MGAQLPDHQVLAGDHRAQRQAAGDALARRDDVGGDALLLDRPHRAAAPDPGLDLVADEQDAVVVAELSQVPEPAIGRDDVAALTEPGLDHDGGDLAGRHDPLEQDLLEVVEVPIEGVIDAGQQRPEVGAVLRLRRGERHGPHRPPVEGLIEPDQVLTAGRVPRELDRRLDRLRPGVGEERARLSARERRHGVEALADVGVDRQIEVRGGVVQQLGGLLLDRLDHGRMAVARRGDGDPGVQVQVDVPVDVFHDRTGPAARHEGIGPRQRRRRDLAVAIDPRHRLGTGNLRDELGPAVARQPLVGEGRVRHAHSEITVRDCSRRYCMT